MNELIEFPLMNLATSPVQTKFFFSHKLRRFSTFFYKIAAFTQSVKVLKKLALTCVWNLSRPSSKSFSILLRLC